MSYILNALRKSEQERQQNREQNLNTRLLEHTPDKRSGVTNRWLMLLIALNAVLLVYVVIRSAGEQTPTPASATAQRQPGAIADAKLPESSEKRPSPEKTAEPLAVAQAQLGQETIAGLIKSKKPQLIKPSPAKPENQSEIEEKPLAEKPVSSTSQVSMLERSESHGSLDKSSVVPATHNAKAATPSSIELTVPTENLVAKGGSLDNEIERTESDIPWLDELPSSFRRNVPELDINVYVYSELAENRFIMVSMHKYLTEQEISTGMMLKDIQEDGIVVEYRGKQFKIRRN